MPLIQRIESFTAFASSHACVFPHLARFGHSSLSVQAHSLSFDSSVYSSDNSPSFKVLQKVRDEKQGKNVGIPGSPFVKAYHRNSQCFHAALLRVPLAQTCDVFFNNVSTLR